MSNKIANPISQNYPKVGISNAFHNKILKAGYGKAAWGNSYTPSQLLANELFNHILSGGAWTPGIFEGNRRTENWQAAFTIALDYDNNTSVAEALSNSFIKGYAALVHPSASSNPAHYKTRVIFILDEPITDHPQRYTALVQAIIEHIGLDADEASAKAAQAFYGSDNRIEEPYINESARLPLKLIGSLTQPLAIREEAERLHRAKLQAERATFTEPPRERAEAYARAAYENTLSQLAQSSKGGRNNALFKAAISLWGRALGGWPYHDVGRIESDLSLIGSGLGLEQHEIQATLISALRSASPQILELPHQAEYKGKTHRAATEAQFSDFIRFYADLLLNVRYMSEALEHLKARTIALRSPLNTGKTEAMIRLIQEQGYRRVLFITHLKALTHNQAERLRAAGIETAHYSEVEQQLYRQNKIVCSINSLDRLMSAPPFDLIILDEASQALPAIYARTMQSAEVLAVYKTLKSLVTDAGQVIALDANLSNLEADLLKMWRGDCVCIDNTYQHEWGELALYDNPAAVVEQAQNLADENRGTVVLTTSSRNYARRLQILFAQRYGAEQVRAIHGWNSQEPDSLDFMTHINTRLASDNLRVLIVSPTVATGIDITTPVAGVFGIFYSDPLTAADMLQMMGRFRNAEQRAAVVMAGIRELETNPAVLIADSESLQTAVAQRVGYTGGQLREHQEIDHLTQHYKAARNRLRNDQYGAFTALAKRQGFELAKMNVGAARRVREALQNAGKLLKEQDTELILSIAPLSREEFEDKRRRGLVREQDHFAYQRWLIEDTTGQDLTRRLLGRYGTARQRKALVRFESLYDKRDLEHLGALDRLELARELADRRGHHTPWAEAFIDAMCYLFGDNPLESTEILSKAEFERRAAAFAEEWEQAVVALEGRNDLSKDPIFIIRRVLAKFGLEIAYKRARNKETGQLEYIYWLDQEALTQLIADAIKRRAHLEAKAASQFHNTGIDNQSSRVIEQRSPQTQKRPPPDPEAPHKPD